MTGVVTDIFTYIFCLTGIVFFFGGTIGILRCPDLYSRLHPSTKGDTLGACMIIFGLCIQSGASLDTIKLLAIVFFLLLSSATCGHAIGRSAFSCGVLPWHKEGVRPLPEEVER